MLLALTVVFIWCCALRDFVVYVWACKVEGKGTGKCQKQLERNLYRLLIG